MDYMWGGIKKERVKDDSELELKACHYYKLKGGKLKKKSV